MSTAGQEGKVERQGSALVRGTGSHTHSFARQLAQALSMQSPPWGGASSPAPLHHTQPPGAAPPLPPPCALRPYPLARHSHPAAL